MEDSAEVTSLNNVEIESISTIVQLFLDRPDLRVKLSTNQINILMIVLNEMPEMFEEITESIKNIAADNAVNVKDVPEFVNIVKHVSNINAKDLKKHKIVRRDIVDFTEAILLVIIDMNVLKLGDNKEEIISLIKSCTILLETSINLSETVSCIWCC